jgi:hypothetical protein
MTATTESAVEEMALLNAARDAGYLAILALIDAGDDDTPTGRALIDAFCALNASVREYAVRHKQRMQTAFDQYLATTTS